MGEYRNLENRKYSKQIPCDGAKLQNLVLEKGLTIAEAGEMIGMSTSAVRNSVKRNEISPHIMLLIDKVLGIPFDLYKFEEPKPELEPEKDAEVDPNGIAYKMMVSAAYAAVADYFKRNWRVMARIVVEELKKEGKNEYSHD